MSHISVYKTQLKGITLEFLKQSLESFIKTQPGMKIITGQDIQRYFWNQHVDIGIMSTKLRSMGFQVKNGCLIIVGDTYNQEQEYARLQDLVPNYVTSQVIMATTRKTHPNAKIQMKVMDREVVMKAYIYEGC